MAKPRKRHVQQEMLTLSGTTRRDGSRRGGKRRGAGRKPKGKRAGSPHKARPEIRKNWAIHVVMRVEKDIGSLRKRDMYRAVREATIAVARRELHDAGIGFFRIVHISIQGNHVHMIVEAGNKTALSRGMQSFQISAAKHLNAAVSVKRGSPRRGRVFSDRFHEEIIKTPTQARHALAYVLNNWRKHREDRSPSARGWNVDAFSTGVQFAGWREREDAVFMWRPRETYKPLVVYLPTSWLLRIGWRERGGGTIPFSYVPGQPRGGVGRT
jgi:REP element-mobilizing transposase RayT